MDIVDIPKALAAPVFDLSHFSESTTELQRSNYGQADIFPEVY